MKGILLLSGSPALHSCRAAATVNPEALQGLTCLDLDSVPLGEESGPLLADALTGRMEAGLTNTGLSAVQVPPKSRKQPYTSHTATVCDALCMCR
jgi:hypothetical protein